MIIVVEWLSCKVTNVRDWLPFGWIISVRLGQHSKEETIDEDDTNLYCKKRQKWIKAQQNSITLALSSSVMTYASPPSPTLITVILAINNVNTASIARVQQLSSSYMIPHWKNKLELNSSTYQASSSYLFTFEAGA